MANTITNVTPQLLAQGLLALRQQAIMPRLVNRSYETLAQQKGNVINIPIPSAITARAITPSVTQNSNQDFSPTTVAVTLDWWYEASFQLSDTDMLACMDGIFPMQASEAIKALANGVDSYILGKHTGIYGAAGLGQNAAGAFATSVAMAGEARAVLNRQLAPLDDRRAVLNPEAEANFLTLAEIMSAERRGDTGGIIQGTIGRKMGVDWYLENNLPTFTCGTAAASGYAASTVSGSIGDSTLNVLNLTATGAIKVGDIFSLTNDPEGYQYVITTALASVSGSAATCLVFTPALKTTVATGATLIFVSGTYVANLMFHRDAFAFASRPLQDIAGYGNNIMTATDPVSGLALRLEVSRQYRQTTFSYDILCGARLVRAELACKMLGY